MCCLCLNPLNAELNPICHLLALLGSATIIVISRLRVKRLPEDGQYVKPTRIRELTDNKSSVMQHVAIEHL
jgi:hypothetical protein